jgi:hypothetical protein
VLTVPREVNPVPWAKVPTQGRHTTTHILDIAPMTGGHLFDTQDDGGFGAVVLQPTEPTAESGRLGQAKWLDCIHLDTFSAQLFDERSDTRPIGEITMP